MCKHIHHNMQISSLTVNKVQIDENIKIEQQEMV